MVAQNVQAGGAHELNSVHIQHIYIYARSALITSIVLIVCHLASLQSLLDARMMF
jgi:hypothetical protein